MFANLLRLITPRPVPGVDRLAFVEEVRVRDVERRSSRVEWMILACWVLIAVKHVAIIWVCRQYPVPFHQLWINFPTWLLGLLATAVYFRRIDRSARRK